MKRICCFALKSANVSSNNSFFHHIDLLNSNFYRKAIISNNCKYSKNYLIPLDLVNLITKFSQFVVLFDIYDPKRVTIQNKKNETEIKSIKHHWPGIITSSKAVRNFETLTITNTSELRYLVCGLISHKVDKKDDLNIYPFKLGRTYGYAWFFMYYHSNWCGVQCQKESIITNKTRFTDTEHEKINILKLKKEYNKLELYINNKLVYNHKLNGTEKHLQLFPVLFLEAFGECKVV